MIHTSFLVPYESAYQLSYDTKVRTKVRLCTLTLSYAQEHIDTREPNPIKWSAGTFFQMPQLIGLYSGSIRMTAILSWPPFTFA